MEYVKECDRNTAWYLFNELFYVRVNPHHVRTVEEIKLYGTPTTGNEDYDRELAKNQDLVMLSIAQMEDIYNNGYPVNIVNYDDTKLIYQRLTNHLVAMKNLMTGSENVTNDSQTLNELIRLDKFAASFFQHARHLVTTDILHSPLAQRMQSSRFSALGKSIRNRPNPTIARDPASIQTAPISGGGRDYSTGNDVKPQVQENPNKSDEIIDDPNLPKRISLENMFERQKQLGATRWS